MMLPLNSSFGIVKEIALNPFVVLVIYHDADANTNDAIIVKNKPQSQSIDEFNNRAIETISSVSVRRKSENRTEIMTLEFDDDFYITVEKVKETSPILIRSEGEPDLLLFDYEHYMELFGFLYTEEQIAEIEAGCANCKESYE